MTVPSGGVGASPPAEAVKDELDEAHRYIADVRWRYASTMPDWPHEYTVKVWRPQDTARFEGFCRLIAACGVIEPWPPPPASPIYHNPYLVIGGRKYWALGPHRDRDAPEGMTVINRARADG